MNNACAAFQKGVFLHSRGRVYRLFSPARMVPSPYSLCNLQHFVCMSFSVCSQLSYLGTFVLHCFMTLNSSDVVSAIIPTATVKRLPITHVSSVVGHPRQTLSVHHHL